MGLFKGLTDKPYTKADYYRELEERAAAKLAAKAAHVVLLPTKEPEWSELEVIVTTSTTDNKDAEMILVPFEETIESTATVVESVVVVASNTNTSDETLPDETVKTIEEPKKVIKSKRKKAG